MIKRSEDDFQKSCVKWLKLQHPGLLVHHSPNGGKRNAREAAKFKAMGTRAGCPDLQIYRRNGSYAGLAIEIKVGDNKPTDNQISFMRELTAQGWFCIVINHMDLFIKTVNGYMRMP